MQIPVSYQDDRARAEQILLEVANRHTVKIAEMGEDALQEMERRYLMKREHLKPHVYWRLTDNWVELTVRFITKDHGIRELKNCMSREILQLFDESKIGIASGTYAVVQMPPLKVSLDGPVPAAEPRHGA